MAGYSIEGVKETLRLEGVDKEAQKQETVVLAAIADLEETTAGKTVKEELDKVRLHRGTVWDAVAEGVDCGKGFSADFQDLTALLMRAFGDFSLLGSLQGLLDNLNIFPPGFGFPSFDFDFDWPSLDFGLSLDGGWDLSNLFDFGDMLNFDGFRLPGCDTVSSDKFVSPLAENNYLENLDQPKKFISKFHEQTEVALNLDTPTTTLGKQIVKTKTDENGDPFYEAFSRGETCVSPRFDCMDEKKISKAIVEFLPPKDDSKHLGTTEIDLTETVDKGTGKNNEITSFGNTKEAGASTQIETTPDKGGYYHDNNKSKTKINALADNSGYVSNRLQKNTAQFSNIQYENAGKNAPNQVDHSQKQKIEFDQKKAPSTSDHLNPFFNQAQLDQVATPFTDASGFATGKRKNNKRDLDPKMYGQPGTGLHQYDPDATISTSSGQELDDLLKEVFEQDSKKSDEVLKLTKEEQELDAMLKDILEPDIRGEVVTSAMGPYKRIDDDSVYYSSSTSKNALSSNEEFDQTRTERNTQELLHTTKHDNQFKENKILDRHLEDAGITNSKEQYVSNQMGNDQYKGNSDDRLTPSQKFGGGNGKEDVDIFVEGGKKIPLNKPRYGDGKKSDKEWDIDIQVILRDD